MFVNIYVIYKKSIKSTENNLLKIQGFKKIQQSCKTNKVSKMLEKKILDIGYLLAC